MGKYHISVCVYLTGGFLKYLPHGQACGEEAGLSDLEEYGSKYKYKCPFENCDKGTAKAKAIGYKEFSIHAGVMHGILERWAEDSEREGAKDLYELLKSQREEEGKALMEVPQIPFEEVHTCCICNGQDKEGKNLSFSKEKFIRPGITMRPVSMILGSILTCTLQEKRMSQMMVSLATFWEGRSNTRVERRDAR